MINKYIKQIVHLILRSTHNMIFLSHIKIIQTHQKLKKALNQFFFDTVKKNINQIIKKYSCKNEKTSTAI